MNQTTIQEQIDAIHAVTAKACKTKESALKFLIDAGILTITSEEDNNCEEE